MAAATDIVLNDGQSTPAAHTFSPARKSGDRVVWEERSTASTASGFYLLTTKANPPSSASVIRNKITLAIPLEIYDSVSQTYSYPDIARLSADILIPVNATSADRKNMAAYVKNLFAHATIVSMLEDLDVPY